jgi:hypothetical protein
MRIMKLLKKKDQFACLTVSKSWYFAAIESFYSIHRFTKHTIPFVRRKLALTEEGQDQKLEFGKFVTNLAILRDNGDKYEFTRNEMMNLLSHIPNVAKFNFFDSCHYDKYIEILVHGGGDYLNGVQTIKRRERTYSHLDELLYFQACYAFSRSLTDLTIDYEALTSYYSFDYILQIFPAFKFMKNLAFTRIVDSSFKLFDVISMFPNLSSIGFEHTNLRLNIIENSNKTKFEENRLILRGRSLKSLSIDLKNLSTPYMQYIIHCLPHSLQSIKIKVQEESFDNWITQTDNDIVSEIAQRLSTIPNVTSLFPNDFPHGEAKFFNGSFG